MKKQKFIKWILIIIFCIIAVIFGLLFLRFRNGRIVKTDAGDIVMDEVVTYCQDDEKWAEDKLGESSYTMKSSGCLVTCIATASSMETGEVITPGELNRIFSTHDVYDSEGNIQWAEIAKIDGYFVNIYDEVSEDIIYQCLKEGHYPIVRVRMNGLGNFHYVLIVGIENGEYICMDPLEDEVTKLSDYMNLVYAVRVVEVHE